MNVLPRILASKREELATLVAPTSSELAAAPPVRPVEAVLARGPALHLLTEIKLRSPSAGALDATLSPAERALAYARAGATLISVLCDGPFFGGAYAHLVEARRALTAAGFATPLLAKEFIVDERQLATARAHGADTALLIVRILDDATLARLVTAARRLGFEPLVEVADEAEVARALAADARILGVNARDLDTLVMDAERAKRVLAAIPPGRIALHLSGVKTPADIEALRSGRADGALVGEVLMRQADPTALLTSLAQAARR